MIKIKENRGGFKKAQGKENKRRVKEYFSTNEGSIQDCADALNLSSVTVRGWVKVLNKEGKEV